MNLGNVSPLGFRKGIVTTPRCSYTRIECYYCKIRLHSPLDVRKEFVKTTRSSYTSCGCWGKGLVVIQYKKVCGWKVGVTRYEWWDWFGRYEDRVVGLVCIGNKKSWVGEFRPRETGERFIRFQVDLKLIKYLRYQIGSV